MTMMSAVTAIALLIIVVGCVAALFSPHYHDSWLQHVALIAIGSSGAVLFDKTMRSHWVPAEMVIFVIGVAAFAVGMAHKVYRHRNDPPRGKQVGTSP